MFDAPAPWLWFVVIVMPTGPTHRLSFAVCKTAHITVIDVIVVVVVVVIVVVPPPPPAAETSTLKYPAGADSNSPGAVNTNG